MVAAKILIVEDQNAFMIENLLHLYAPDSDIGESQFEFEIIKDGCEAIARLAGSLPDLILLDLRLPGVGGLVVLEAIRKVDSCLSVIVVSAYGDKRTRQEAMRLGANDFFQKPVNTMKLYRRMRELLSRQPRTAEREARVREATLQLDSLKTQYLAKYRRLLKLQERAAQLGSAAPPELLMEIEDLKQDLVELEQDRHLLASN